MDKKIPLSTYEAGFINYADSFSIPIQGLKDECLIYNKVTIKAEIQKSVDQKLAPKVELER